jgi:tungstate transport system substrate-binding protein
VNQRLQTLLRLLVAALFLAACAPTGLPRRVLRLATTTSTADSGLLEDILPAFEAAHNARVDMVAVGTGQALALGASGDADVILVHARAREDEFMAAGDGAQRLDVMYNDFVLVGPAADPASVEGTASAAEALKAIAAARAPFASRGDDSGTHSQEQSLWASAGLVPDPGDGWYLSLGQGMGDTLQFASERPAYTLTDRATWLAQQDNLPNLRLLFGGATIAQNPDPALHNPYGVITVSPEKHPGVNFALATEFAEWLTAVETQKLIGSFGQAEFGQALFNPGSEAWQAAGP